MAKAIVAGMAGMAAAKFIPTLIPGQFVQGNLMRTVATGASAFVAQMIARAVVKDQTVADAVLFGGLIQTGSVALNAFLPAIARQVGLAGIMNADWSIPENPLRALPVAAPVAMSGLARAYGGY
jgi:hypothetical protein